WALHLVGAMQVTLACVLAGEPVFALLLAAYVLCGLWSLALFYLQREQQKAVGVTSLSPTADRRPPTDYQVPWRALGLWPAGRWTFAIFLFALVLFLIAPRGGNSYW